MRKRMTAAAAALLFVCCLLTGGGKSEVHADAGNTFSGDVGVLRRDNGNYVMQVTVENNGEDFSGTVQLIFASSGYGAGNCAYNTEVDLPAQGKKQFTVTVPERAAETVEGMCALNFLDGEGELLQSVRFKDVFGIAVSGIPMGILSDDYSGLTFLDAGGLDIEAHGMRCPLNLVELDKDNVGEYLNGLSFLVIDRFHTAELEEEDIQAIQNWVKDGGWLIVGTGNYGEQTLSGFEKDFMDVDILSVSEPGDENALSIDAEFYDYFYYFVADGVDFTQMSVAELSAGDFQQSPDVPAIRAAVGDGAVMVLPFSLEEKELQKLRGSAILDIYEDVMYYSGSYMDYENDSNVESSVRSALALIDNNSSDISFTRLEVLIGIYVVLIGPVLYLILRKCKKREWYWVCVPAAGLLFIGGVFLFGQGLRVSGTRVYSATVQRVEGGRADTYLLAYRSGLTPWTVRLNDSYEVAGPGWNGYTRNFDPDTDDYSYLVNCDSEGLSVGIKPQENFENGFLYAGKKAESMGTFSGEDIGNIYGTVAGRVTNATDCDLDYMAVWSDSCIMVFSDVKAGESFDLQQAVLDGRCVYEDNLYNMSSVYAFRSVSDYGQEDLAAFLILVEIAEEAKPTDGEYVVAAGVVENYDKAVADKCDETSYGCFYTYMEVEAGQNAAY